MGVPAIPPAIPGRNRESRICVFLIAALSTGCAAKSPYSGFDIKGGIISSSNIFFSVEDRLGIITGVVENQLDKMLLTQNALKLDGVDEVRNRVRVLFGK